MTYQIESLKKLAKMEESIGSGDRIARLIAKTVTDKRTGNKTTAIDGRAVSESMAVVVPHVTVSVLNAIIVDDTGKQWMIDKVESLQDAVIRRAFGAGKNAIFDDQISVGALLVAMMQEEAATRFSKESIGTWFDADVLPLLQSAIRHKLMGISEEKLVRLTDGYRDDFRLLAAREVFMAPEIKVKLQKVIDLLPDDYESEYAATAQKVFEKFAAAGTQVKRVEDVL